MRNSRMILTLLAVVSGLSLPLGGAEGPPPAAQADQAPSAVNDRFPGLAVAGLTFARLSDLPAGVLLKADDLIVGEKELTEEMTKAPKEVQEQLKKNRFFLLENMATQKLLLRMAKADAANQKKEAAPLSERELIDDYLKRQIAQGEVSDSEVADFYEKNKDLCGGAKLDQVKDQLKQYVLQQKQQEAIDQYIRTLGQRMPVVVSAAWTKEQAALAKDNPVDKARASGKPSLVDFGASGCRPCDMMTPILANLREKFSGKLNVLFVHVREEQILAARYGVQTIPIQVFYDKDGKEVLRHTGFFPQPEIEKELAKMGVK